MTNAYVGLCHTCGHHRRIESSKGSVFYLCMLSEHDAHFAKYPRLPVTHCVGYEHAPDMPKEIRGNKT